MRRTRKGVVDSACVFEVCRSLKGCSISLDRKISTDKAVREASWTSSKIC